MSAKLRICYQNLGLGDRVTRKIHDLLNIVNTRSPHILYISETLIDVDAIARIESVGYTVGWSLFLKIDINFMDIKSCVLFTELGRIVVKSLVFYITKSTPRPTHLGGKTMDWEEFF